MNQKSEKLNYKYPDMEFVMVKIEQGFFLSGSIEDVGKDEESEF